MGSRDGQSVANIERRLREEILTGGIPAGSVTSQAALSERFEVGRTPLREALRLLEGEGLIVTAPNRRVRIADLDTGKIAEVLTVMKKRALEMWEEGERLTGHPGLPLEPTPNLAAAE